MKKLILLLIVIYVSFSAYSQESPPDSIAVLDAKIEQLSNTISVMQDSIKQLKTKRSELQIKTMVNSVRGLTIETLTHDAGKLKKEPKYDSEAIEYFGINEKIILTDYVYGYWLVVKGEKHGFISSLCVKENEDIKLLKQEFIKRHDKLLEQKNIEYRAKTKEYRNKIIAKYGKEIGTKLLNRDYWIGMTTEMAEISLGRPETKNISVGSWGVKEQWVYYNKYLYFTNGKLTNYQIH